MHRILLSTHGLRLRAPLRSRGLRSLGLGVFLASTAALAGCSSARSYACAVDRPMDCGAPGVGERRSFGSYLCEVDSPLACGATGVGARRSFGSYTCEVDSPLACGATGVGARRSFGSYTCEVLSPLSCCATANAGGRAAAASAPGLPDRPPAARPGEAWCKVLIPARYETVTEEIETVCPSVQRDWVPPIMETRVIPVVIQPACTDVIRTPGATRLDPICTELCPPRTETRVVVTKDACGCGTKSCETVHVPAVNGIRTREVLVTAPGTQVVSVPAMVSADVCEVEVRPGYWRETRIPGVKERRSRVVCVAPERWEWQKNPSYVPPAPPPPPCAPARPATAR